MSILDKVVKFVGGDLTPGFNLPSANVSVSPGGVPGASKPAGFTSTATPGSEFLQPNGNVLGASTSAPSAAAPAPAAGNNVPVDPYTGTPFGSTAGYHKALADYTALKGNTMNSINSTIDQSSQGLHSSILDYLEGRGRQQSTIDSKSVQNELAREQGGQGILDMVGNGIRSGGVTLAHNNAGSSSGADALARAYSVLGRQQMSSVGNQFAQGQNEIQTDQNNLMATDATQIRHSEEDKTKTINSIVTDASDKLSRLNAAAANASLPDRVQIDQEIARIKQQALTALSSYDQELSQGISSQVPQSADATRAKANDLRVAGVAPENAFNFTAEAPAQFQNTGQFASSLPIFTGKRRVTA